jgi:hypothetical protein
MRVASGGTLLAAAVTAAALTAALVGSGVAQDATPTATDEAGGFPNHFHLGTCDALDPAPAIPLADLHFPEWVGAMSADDEVEAESVMADPADFGNAPIPVAVATTEVAVPLADILASGHALNVHDAENPDVYLACGNIGGIPDQNGDVFVGLDPVEDSGYSGVVWLHDTGAGTTVVVFLSHPAGEAGIDAGLAALLAAAAAEAGAATPDASPAPMPEAGADATPVA